MNIDEAKRLLAACAAFDNRQPSLIAARAWAKSLEDMPLDQDAFDAVAVFYGTPAAEPGRPLWIQPADVRAVRAKLREKRLENFVYEPPRSDRDPAYLQRLRGQIHAIASGAVPPPAERPALDGPPHPSIAKRLAGIGREVPPEEMAKVRRPGPHGVECPQCKAPVGRPCRTPGGKPRSKAHAARYEAAGVPGAHTAPVADAEVERRRAASQAFLERGEAS